MAAYESPVVPVPAFVPPEPIQPGKMVVEPYKKSVAIFGDTKLWKENIKKMGGRFNGFLKRAGPDGPSEPGWLFFDQSQIAEVKQFVDQANAGQIKPLSPQTAAAGSGPRTRVATGNKLQYQTISYRVVLPYAGQGVTLTIPDDSERLLVVSTVIIGNQPGTVDIITLKDGEAEMTGAIVSGVWEILDFGRDHTLTFH